MTQQQAKLVRTGDTIVDKNGTEHLVSYIHRFDGSSDVNYFQTASGKPITPDQVTKTLKPPVRA